MIPAAGLWLLLGITIGIVVAVGAIALIVDHIDHKESE